jgi:hypothetical protein
MVQLKLDTTASQGLRALGTPGQRSFELIVPTVQKALGAEHAALFAEPVDSPRGDQTDWYATVPGTPRRLTDLPPEEQKAVRERLGTLAGAIFAYADRLSANSDQESQRLAQALRFALEVPDETAIFAVGDQPVLTNWARQRDVKEAPKGLLQAMVPMRAPPPPPPPPPVEPLAAGPVAVARSPLDWLWWLTVITTGLVLAWILWLLIAPCGLAGPDWLNTCPRPALASTVDPALEARRAQLEAEIAALERQALAAERACIAQAPPLPAPRPAASPPPPEPEPEPDDIDQRRAEAGGQEGELTITLVWESTADLDLHITCPGGQVINYTNTTGCNGGELDVDANVGSNRTSTPVENVFFRAGAEQGTYRIRVHMFDNGNGGSSHSFRVRVQMGDQTETFSGTVSSANPNWTRDFEYRG